MNESDSIYAKGFLSPEIERFRQGYRRQYQDAFIECEFKSNVATALFFAADVSYLNLSEQRHIVLGIALWCRSLRACQGAFLMIERGMSSEAQILLRSAYEFLFVGAASVMNGSLFQRLIEKDNLEVKKQASGMLKEGKKAGNLTATDIKNLEELIEEGAAAAKNDYSVWEAANEAGYLDLYETVYRGLSLVASHGTLRATSSVFEEREDGRMGFCFGPDNRETQFTLGLLDRCLAEGIKRFHQYLTPQAKSPT